MSTWQEFIQQQNSPLFRLTCWDVLINCVLLGIYYLICNFKQAQFEDIKKIVDQMWETLSENLKKVN